MVAAVDDTIRNENVHCVCCLSVCVCLPVVAFAPRDFVRRLNFGCLLLFMG